MKRLCAALVTAFAISSPQPAHATTVLISGDPLGNDEIEAFIAANFVLPAGTTFLTGDFANYENNKAAIDSANVVFIGRNLNSGSYQNGVADGYNTLNAPVILFTSYVARETGNRLGWHTAGAASGASVLGNETTVTSAGATLFGLAAGAYNFFEGNPGDTFNGLSGDNPAVGGGSVISTIVGPNVFVSRLQAAYWAEGSAPGDPVAASPTGDPDFVFPGKRLLFNLDDDVAGGVRTTFSNLTVEGEGALVASIGNVTGWAVIPEPSSALLALVGAAAFLRRRRA